MAQPLLQINTILFLQFKPHISGNIWKGQIGFILAWYDLCRSIYPATFEVKLQTQDIFWVVCSLTFCLWNHNLEYMEYVLTKNQTKIIFWNRDIID